MFFQVGSELANKQLDQVSKKYKSKFFACELAIRRVALLMVRRRRTQYGIEEDAGRSCWVLNWPGFRKKGFSLVIMTSCWQN